MEIKIEGNTPDDWRQSIRVENICAEPQFEELLELAIDTCLLSDDYYKQVLESLRTRYNQQPTEARILQRLGLTGLQASLANIFNGAPQPDTKSDEESDTKNSAHTADYFAIAAPHLFGEQTETRIQNKIEAFGEALLYDAFSCLGSDAESMVNKFTGANTVREQYDVLHWLATRLTDITNIQPSNKELTAEEQALVDEVKNDDFTGPDIMDGFYHPARLSPKLLGTYPSVNYEPTCLGVSILAASFFNKAGADFLHAGVMETANEVFRNSYILGMTELIDQASINGISVPDSVHSILNDACESQFDILLQDRGYHAACVVRMMDGSWAQIDPNFSSTCNMTLDKKSTESLNKTYNYISDISEYNPGIEVIFRNKVPTNGAYLLYESYKELAESMPSIEEICETLQTDLSPQEFYRIFMLDPLLKEKDQSRVYRKRDMLIQNLVNLRGTDMESYLYSESEAIIRNYVFTDNLNGDITESLKRCRNDEAYRQRRAEDLMAAPLYLVSRLERNSLNTVLTDNRLVFPHSILDLGMASYRIGMCVLSDFAVYCGDELPFSFWNSYWPSRISATEHLPRNEDSKAQHNIADNNMNLFLGYELHYYRSYYIIKMFLERENKKEVAAGGSSRT